MALRKKTEPPPPEPRNPDDVETAVQAYARSLFPIVGVGASAGGIEAFSEVLRNLPPAPGVAIVFVLHQEPTHPSALVDVLGRTTNLPVELAVEGARVEVNRIFVAPPDAEVILEDAELHLRPRKTDGIPMPVDALFRSLAEDQGSRAISIVLSGTANDGALGSRAIKAEGGITFAQDESARFDGMPTSAVGSSVIDFVLPPKEIARELARIARHTYVAGSPGEGGRLPERELVKVFALLQAAHDVDFSHYKPSTIERRIRRRMALLKIDDFAAYIALLRKDPSELEQLYTDILIRVTSFFRDPEVYEALQRDVFPSLLFERRDDPVRVWVPGCATGEEVYSIAIALMEVVAAQSSTVVLQIFGTDISEASIDQARTAIYSEAIAADVSPERLRRYFTKVDGGYRVAKTVRDRCVFARQNLTKDPPFSRIDLVSCRNVLIYLGAAVQRKVMAIFHFALRPTGSLLLGSSESIGNFNDLFLAVDRKTKIYRKRDFAPRAMIDFLTPVPYSSPVEAAPHEVQSGSTAVVRDVDRILLARYVPPGVLINAAMEIVQFRGRTSPSLEPAAGAASFNLFRMAREGLRPELRAAIHAARKQDVAVRREGARVKDGASTTHVTIDVIPVTTGPERHYLVLFETVPAPDEPERPKRGAKNVAKSASQAKNLARMERELEASRDYLQSIIEEQEAMNEELRSANEEIQSSNEELQSTNEELETAKEELQSSNEELTTLNEELENRNIEMTEANNDLVNLLASVDLPIVMLDRRMRIRRFNSAAPRILTLIPSDIGRPLNDLKTTLQIEDLEELVRPVIETLTVVEKEVQGRGGKWYSLRIRPYMTTDHKIDGAVVMFVDIPDPRKPGKR